MIDLLFPVNCIGCGGEFMAGNDMLCPACLTGLPRCAYTHLAGNRVEKLFHGRMPVYEATSLLFFRKGSVSQRLIHLLKYRGRKSVGSLLGEMLAEEIQNSDRFQEVEAVLAVPLTSKKKRTRGYNQVDSFARKVSSRLNIPYYPKAIMRRTGKGSQVAMDRWERNQSIRRDFHVRDCEALENKHILLVDDVITTGATLESCALQLIKIKGVRVSVASMAFTL